MAKWKNGQQKFSVGLFYDDRRGCMPIIPKPIVEKLGESGEIKFEIKENGSIVAVAGK